MGHFSYWQSKPVQHSTLGSNEESNGESSGEVAEKSNGIGNLNKTEKQIVTIIAENSNITQKDLAIQIGMSEGGVRKAMTKLKKAGIITREGSTKNGSWKVADSK
ncbi:Winged helix-turn-helix DNA-binding [Oribacterium sp. KHPX15]|nr:Winged helix-turn-helix DNA-binding [Oribacterium sp. KHPX15]